MNNNSSSICPICTTWLSNVFCSYCSIFLQCNIKFKLVCWWLVLRLRAGNQRALLNVCTPSCFHLSMYACTAEGLARNTCNLPQWLISDACNSVPPRILLGSGVEEGCLNLSCSRLRLGPPEWDFLNISVTFPLADSQTSALCFCWFLLGRFILDIISLAQDFFLIFIMSEDLFSIAFPCALGVWGLATPPFDA